MHPKSRIKSIGYADGLFCCGDHDQRSRCSDTRLPTRNGDACSESCRSRRQAPKQREVTDFSSKPSCSAPRRACRGEIYRSVLVRGSRSTTALRTGRGEDIGQRYSASCSWRSMRLALSSTAPSFALIKMRRAEKGDRAQCSGTLSRRRFDKAPRRRRHQRPTAPRRAHAGAAARDDHGR